MPLCFPSGSSYWTPTQKPGASVSARPRNLTTPLFSPGSTWHLSPTYPANKKKKEVGNKKNELINSCKDEICNIACEMFRTQNSKHTQKRNMIYGDNKYFLIKMLTIWGITYKRMTKISSQLTLISVQRSSMKLAEICIKKTKSNVKILN